MVAVAWSARWPGRVVRRARVAVRDSSAPAGRVVPSASRPAATAPTARVVVPDSPAPMAPAAYPAPRPARAVRTARPAARDSAAPTAPVPHPARWPARAARTTQTAVRDSAAPPASARVASKATGAEQRVRRAAPAPPATGLGTVGHPVRYRWGRVSPTAEPAQLTPALAAPRRAARGDSASTPRLQSRAQRKARPAPVGRTAVERSQLGADWTASELLTAATSVTSDNPARRATRRIAAPRG